MLAMFSGKPKVGFLMRLCDSGLKSLFLPCLRPGVIFLAERFRLFSFCPKQFVFNLMPNSVGYFKRLFVMRADNRRIHIFLPRLVYLLVENSIRQFSE